MIKNPKEMRLINIITMTRIMPSLSERSIVPKRGFINPMISRIVIIMATLMIFFLPSRNPL